MRRFSASILVVFLSFGSSASAQEPAPLLTAPFDLFILLDESGSIASLDFERERGFARDLVNGLLVHPDFAHVGVGAYGTTARTILDLSASKQAVLNSLVGIFQAGGNTCMTCAFDIATAQFADHGRGAGTPQITLFITDGQNNVLPDQFAASLAALHSVSTVFAIGVDTAVSLSQIGQIASDVDGVQTVFLAPSFAQLGATLDPLLDNIALAVTAIPEPETYALLLAGLGLLGFAARRKMGTYPN